MADELADESSLQGKEDDELDELLDSKLFLVLLLLPIYFLLSVCKVD